jgi:hypothetical protein
MKSSTNRDGHLDKSRRASRQTETGISTNQDGRLDKPRRASRQTETGISTNQDGWGVKNVEYSEKIIVLLSNGWKLQFGVANPDRDFYLRKLNEKIFLTTSLFYSP